LVKRPPVFTNLLTLLVKETFDLQFLGAEHFRTKKAKQVKAKRKKRKIVAKAIVAIVKTNHRNTIVAK
jgi:hypothetical protein